MAPRTHSSRVLGEEKSRKVHVNGPDTAAVHPPRATRYSHKLSSQENDGSLGRYSHGPLFSPPPTHPLTSRLYALEAYRPRYKVECFDRVPNPRLVPVVAGNRCAPRANPTAPEDADTPLWRVGGATLAALLIARWAGTSTKHSGAS